MFGSPRFSRMGFLSDGHPPTRRTTHDARSTGSHLEIGPVRRSSSRASRHQRGRRSWVAAHHSSQAPGVPSAALNARGRRDRSLLLRFRCRAEQRLDKEAVAPRRGPRHWSRGLIGRGMVAIRTDQARPTEPDPVANEPGRGTAATPPRHRTGCSEEDHRLSGTPPHRGTASRPVFHDPLRWPR